VPEFQPICNKLTQKFTISGKSKSCIDNYLREISKMVIYFNRSPLDLNIDDLDEYLCHLRANDQTPSLSCFKHLVYGLRFLYTHYHRDDMQVHLPSIKSPNTLPEIFSKQEIKSILKTPKLLKHRVMFALIYDTGIRISEFKNLLVSDLDLNRRSLHIRQGKGKKDRYVHFSKILARGLYKYLDACKPSVYLFNGKAKGSPMCLNGIRDAMHKVLKTCNITKKVCVHSLRHSFATHLIEEGVDLVTVKNLLGHARIDNTLMYVHIARTRPKPVFSPLDMLYGTK
jgi:site-specific recombinase XerD